LDLAQAGGAFQLAIQQGDQLALGGQLPHPPIGPVRRHQAIKHSPRHMLQKLMKDAIVMLHGIAPLVSGSSPNVPTPSGINAMRFVHQNSTGQPWVKPGHDEWARRDREDGEWTLILRVLCASFASFA